jgi:hypothetical protein
MKAKGEPLRGGDLAEGATGRPYGDQEQPQIQELKKCLSIILPLFFFFSSFF